ncbi:MAG: diacylglycerol kinase (ATP) [Gammaproteobacteria bacterium]|jgi:diacylglycerol kinase (ATP)
MKANKEPKMSPAADRQPASPRKANGGVIGEAKGETSADAPAQTPEGAPATTLELRPYRRALVIANPISGRGLALRAANELRLGLEQSGVPTSLYETRAKRDAFSRLRTLDQSTDLVVAVGGDGTVGEVIDGLVDPEVHVGVLPFGTANVLAEEFELPRDVHHALEILRKKRVRHLDVAFANGQLSFLAVGIGIDGKIVREVERARTGPITKFAYLKAAARVLPSYKPPRLQVEVDGKEIKGEYGFVLVGNLQNYGGLFHLAPDASSDDGLLEAYLFPTGKRWELVRAFGRSIFGHLPGDGITMHRGRHVRVTSLDEEPTAVQVDGDSAGTTPVEVEMGPNRYRLIVP